MTSVDLIATIPVPRGSLDAAATMLLAYGELVRSEPGNQRFEVFSDADGAALIVIERYTDSDAFQVHLANPANADFNARLGVLLGGGGSSLTFLARLG